MVPANTLLKGSAIAIQTFYWLGQERKTSWNDLDQASELSMLPLTNIAISGWHKFTSEMGSPRKRVQNSLRL